MITLQNKRREQKYFFVKSYPHLWLLEEAIKILSEHASYQLQISVLGKMGVVCIFTNKEFIRSKKELKLYWKDNLGANSHFGLFCNPEIGTLFIAGSLVSQFLNKLDGKFLGEIPSGLFGILKGLGLEEPSATWHLNALIQGHYVLLIRGYDFQLQKVEELIGQLG